MVRMTNRQMNEILEESLDLRYQVEHLEGENKVLREENERLITLLEQVISSTK